MVRAADVLTIGLLLLVAWTAYHPLQFRVSGTLVRIRDWRRVLALAAGLAAVRHALIRRQPLPARIGRGCRRTLRRAAAFAARTAPAWAALLLVSAVNAGILLHRYDGGPYLRGDCQYYYWTAAALLSGDGLNLGRQLPGGWRAHLDQVSFSIANEPVPKHPVVLPVLSLPLVAAFGEPGALAFNVAQMTLLVWLLYRLSCAAARPVAAAAAVVVSYAGSFLPHYVWNYSPDVCATLFVVGGSLLAASARSWRGAAAAGVLLGLAIAAKLSMLAFVPGAIWLAADSDRRRIAALAGGLAVPLAGLAILNLNLFGSPWVTSYDRIATVNAAGALVLYSHGGFFSGAVADGIRGQLVDRTHGLLFTSPVTLLALAGLPALWRRRPRLAAHVAASSGALFLVFSTYDQWDASHYGNRFLMPLAAAMTVPLAAGLDRLAARRPTARAA